MSRDKMDVFVGFHPTRPLRLDREVYSTINEQYPLSLHLGSRRGR